MEKAIIKKELLNMGFNPLHIGTEYLAEAIYIAYNSNKTIYKINLEKDVYKEIGIKNKKNTKTIKSNIVKATNAVDIKRNMNNQINNFKLTPKLVIYLVIQNINEKNI